MFNFIYLKLSKLTSSDSQRDKLTLFSDPDDTDLSLTEVCGDEVGSPGPERQLQGQGQDVVHTKTQPGADVLLTKSRLEIIVMIIGSVRSSRSHNL